MPCKLLTIEHVKIPAAGAVTKLYTKMQKIRQQRIITVKNQTFVYQKQKGIYLPIYLLSFEVGNYTFNLFHLIFL